ncbi:uncharacterized protein LOC126832119 [Patella vulgata]|uniref:uncharacterized protein LOC126832119 n=1 Tax=Patella vulgata TaxID=6465 RepID=UPI0021808967|nr:uncharacterized protein LOC126832119 [Patella vulgata]
MMYITKPAAYYAAAVILLVLSCDGCYTNYNNCQQQYVTATGSSNPPLTQQQICGAATTATICLDTDAADCPLGTAVPPEFTQIKTTINTTVMGCGISNSCFQKVLECANYSTELANDILNINFTDVSTLQSISSTMCPAFGKITGCYSELTLTCTNPAFANATSSLDDVRPLIAQLCGNDTGMQGGCLQKSMECSTISRNIFSVDFTDMSAIQNLAPMICSTMPNLTTCYNQLTQECPTFIPANATSPLDALKPMIDQMCGAGGNCMGCVTPFMAAGCQNTSQDDYESTYRCCGVSLEMSNCFKRNQCTQVPVFGDTQQFELALEMQCSGYQEYCPGLSACLSPFGANRDLITVCSQIDSFMTCVNTACKDKPKVGDLTLTQIMPLYQQICTGLSAYPAIGTCPTFGTCTRNGVSALIPEPVTLKSISAVGNPEHWCKMAKGISNCVSAAPTPCKLGGNSVADAASIKTTTDTICNGVRNPCPGVAACLSTLGSDRSVIQSCPNIPAFVTCVTAALDTCGESSKVKASYSLTDIQTLFTQSCTVFPNFAGCQQTSICMEINLPSGIAEVTDKISDQTYWCNSLKLILKCTTAFSQTCNQTATVTQTLTNLLNQVKVHCPDQGGFEETTTVVTTEGNNTAISEESSVMLVLVASFVIRLY